MSDMKIPFDELEVFHKDQFQQFVDETLIVSTVVYQYLTGKERNSNFILTKRNIYILKGAEPSLLLPTKTLLRIIRSHQHPEIVIQFADKERSIRIATTTIERCELIVQGLSYVSNMFYQRPLLCFTLELNTLEQFVDAEIAGVVAKGNQETPVHKMLRECTNVQTLYYSDKPATSSETEKESYQKVLFSSSSKYKVSLKKIVFKEKLRQMDGYSLFVCKIEEESVVCRVYEKERCTLTDISRYSGSGDCETLLMVLETTHKYFMVFQYIPPISVVTEKYLKLLVRFIIASNLNVHSIRKKNLILGAEGPKWKESRYANKAFDQENAKDFSYTPPQCLFQKIVECFQQRIYSIGILLYHIIYKNPPFLTDSFEVSLHIKQVEGARFPKYLKYYISSELKEFIERCTNPVIIERFNNPEDVLRHPWFVDTLQ